MGWEIGFDENWKRDVGYGVPAQCDHPGCTIEIDRGLSYVCGGNAFGGDHGCGLFFCGQHLQYAGDKRDNAPLCGRCYSGRGGPFPMKPEVPMWANWKLTDASWAQWRQENPDEVATLKQIVAVSSSAAATAAEEAIARQLS